MSKKTRKKLSKSSSSRPAAKAGDGKAGKTPRKALTKAPKPSAAVRKSVTTDKKRQAAAAAQSIPSLKEGDSAPSFSLPRDGGQVVSSAHYAGHKLAIFFYPRANTPGCTREAMAFSSLADAFAAAGTAVLGVSADPVGTQEKFRDKHGLTIPLVSDEGRVMLEAYGVWQEKMLYGKRFMGISRTTVLIGGDGRIIRIWRNVKVDGHADEVLAAARAAKNA